MSAPQTNVEKQTKRHRPALWGMAAVVVFASVLFFIYLAVVVERGTPEDGESNGVAEPGEIVEPPTQTLEPSQ